MNTAAFKRLVRNEIRALLEADGYPIKLDGVESSQTPEPVSGGQNKLAGLPGAPNGGNLMAADIHKMPAEAKELLTKWAKLAKWALAKYGDVDTWPPQVKEMLVKLGVAYEERSKPTSQAGQRQPSTPNDMPMQNGAF